MGRLPLNGPRWLTLRAAIDLRQQQTGAMPLTITDLEQAMATGKLRIMRRNHASGKSELVPAAFWTGHVIDITLPSSITVYRRTAVDDTPQRWGIFAHQPADRIDGWLFYVWKPDLDGLYPAGARDDPKEPTLPIDCARTALRDLFGEPPPPKTKLTLRAATRAVAEECERRGWKPPSPDTVARALGRRR